jgi:hypothetical protein
MKQTRKDKMPPTEEEKAKYLKINGTRCLFSDDCNSQYLTCGDWNTSDTMVCRNVKCDQCEREWTDEYTLTGVAVEDDT